MNSIERIRATLEGKPTDRRAVSLTLSLYGARLTGCPLSEYYSDPTAYARGQSAVLETFRPDILFGPFSLPLEGAAFGGEVRFFDDQAPNLKRPAVSSVEEAGRLAFPDVDSHPRLLYFREAIRIMAREHGQTTPIVAIVGSPVDLPAMILGVDSWLQTLLFDESGAKRVLDMAAEHFVSWANALFADGASFVTLPTAFANPSVISTKISEQIALPAMDQALSDVKGPVVLHHGGARLNPFLHFFLDLPNVVGFVLHNKDDVAEARDKMGPAPVVVGNIEGPSLFMREKDEIGAECMALLDDTSDDPRFILGTSAADIGFDTPPENIAVFREAAESAAKGEAQWN